MLTTAKSIERRPDAKYSAERRIAAFVRHFGDAHLYLAYHAALPLGLTPDLVYRIHAEFQHDCRNEQLHIPWIATADLLLSNLCSEVGRELYEIDGAVREILLERFEIHPRFGRTRLYELAYFLNAYVQTQLRASSDPDTQDYAKTQQIAAWAYIAPKQAVKKLAIELSDNRDNLDERTDLYRISSITHALAEPLKEYKPLLTYARAMGNYALDRITEAQDDFRQLGKNSHVLGIDLNIPSIIESDKESAKQTHELEPPLSDPKSEEQARDFPEINVDQVADLEIRILNKSSDGYPVELTLNGAQEYAGGRLDPALLPWVPTTDPIADGQRLFGWLLADDKLKAAWAEVRGLHRQCRVRLRIDADIPELHAIPWELLCDSSDSQGLNYLAAASTTPFSRYLAGHQQPGSPILQRPIRMLVVIANPDNQSDFGLQPIETEKEWADLQAALNGADVELIQLPQPCTLPAIETALKAGIHILHFIGHGHYNEWTQTAALFLSDENRRVQPVTDSDFAGMLARQLADTDVHNDDKLRLVFLASCQTAQRSPADAFRGFAPRLVQAGVPAVLAMQGLVPAESARAFATTFYQQLLQHGQADLAANEARSHLLTAKLRSASIPVLFMRLRNGALLGRRGRIAGKNEDFWPFLLDDLRKGKCVPFLGPGINKGLLPSPAEVATKLAERYNYPFSDTHDLAKVARYIASSTGPATLGDEYTRLLRRSLFDYLGIKPTKEDRQRYADANFTETAAGIGWSEKVLALHENEIHHLLAELRLPLYMTTNSDSFMTEALRAKGHASVRRAGPRWDAAQAGTPQYTLDPEPSRENPVVFHLNGYDDDPQQASHLVLSEDDFLTHLVRLSRDFNHILPMDVVGILTESSFLFLGYSLDDWEFRVVLQGLVQSLNRPKKVNCIQIIVNNIMDAEKAEDYLSDYLGKSDIRIYWGTPQQLVTELNGELQKLGVDQDGGVWDDDDW